MIDFEGELRAMLEDYAAHGTPRQRRLALAALAVPAATREGRLAQLFRVMGRKIVAAAHERVFGGEIGTMFGSDSIQ